MHSQLNPVDFFYSINPQYKSDPLNPAVSFWVCQAANDVCWAKKCGKFESALLLQSEIYLEANGLKPCPECPPCSPGDLTGESFNGASETYAVNQKNQLGAPDKAKLLKDMKRKCVGGARTTWQPTSEDCGCG